MANELTTTDNRALAPIRTPEGATALRLMTSSGAWRVDGPDLPNWITPAVHAALPAAIVEARALTTPALGSDFKRLVTSSLVLVAGVGMSREESRAWQASAAEALSGIPADLLEVGCTVAKRTCDHPSKIVPAIIKAVGRAWDDRRTDLARLQRIAAVADRPRPEEPPVCTPAEAKSIMAENGIRAVLPSDRLPSAPRREATIDDYLALGLTEQEAAQAMAERERLLRRSPAKPFASAASEAISEAAKAA